jgi:hypothetical protein
MLNRRTFLLSSAAAATCVAFPAFAAPDTPPPAHGRR